MIATSFIKLARTGSILILLCGISHMKAYAASSIPPVHTVYWPPSLVGYSFGKIQKLAQEGDPAAENILGNHYLHGQNVRQNWKKAAFWYHKAALAGNANAAFSLAFAYNFGEGVPQNTHKAIYWWKKSAKDRHLPG
jgi:TPR repeat protein